MATLTSKVCVCVFLNHILSVAQITDFLLSMRKLSIKLLANEPWSHV